VFWRTSRVPAGAPMQLGEKSKSCSCTVCVGPLGVQATDVFEPEHETAPPQARTATRISRWTRIAGAYRPALANGTSITLET
jgi:hypothetical protein